MLVPVPEDDPPGVLVSVHGSGRPLNTTLPVTIAHVGCVIVPTEGAEGVAGLTLMTALLETGEAHPEALVTVNV